MPNIRFFTRTISKDRDKMVPVYVRLYDGRKTDLLCKSGLHVNPDTWSNKLQKSRRVAQRDDTMKFLLGINPEEGRQKFDNHIDALRISITKDFNTAGTSELTNEWLKRSVDKYWNPDKYTVNLFGFIQEFIDNSEKRINRRTKRPVSYKVRREYEVTFNYLKEYALHSGEKFNFRDIDLEFYDGFNAFLAGRNLAFNTIGKKIQTLKIFLNTAREKGHNTFEYYKDKQFAACFEDTESIYLNEEELGRILEHDFSGNKHLERVRDTFIVACWTGCRYSDLDQIRADNIYEGDIHIIQRKTGNEVEIPLLPDTTAILGKYGGELPRLMSNQKFNDALKLVAKEAGINEVVFMTKSQGGNKELKKYEKWQLVTSHCARRSFATNLYKSGFPELSIRAITGHKSERAFLKYIKVTKKEHAEMLRKHQAKHDSHLKVV